MRVCVFGCGGFIGSRLVDWLLRQADIRLVGVDRDYRRVGHLLSHPRFSYFNSDVNEDLALTAALVRGADVVVNLIAVHPPGRTTDPLNVIAVEFGASLRIAEHCVASQRPLVQLSGGEIYGPIPVPLRSRAGQASGDLPESEASLSPGPMHATRWLHAASRQLLERALNAYGEQRALSCTVVRPFNILGIRSPEPPCRHPDRSVDLLSQLIDDLVHGRPMRAPEDSCRYAFVAIDDVVEGLGRVVLADHPVARSVTMSVGHPGNRVSIEQLAHLVRNAYWDRDWSGTVPPSCVELVARGDFPLEPVVDLVPVIPDVGGMERLFGWRPTVSLDTLVASAVDEFVASHRSLVD